MDDYKGVPGKALSTYLMRSRFFTLSSTKWSPFRSFLNLLWSWLMVSPSMWNYASLTLLNGPILFNYFSANPHWRMTIDFAFDCTFRFCSTGHHPNSRIFSSSKVGVVKPSDRPTTCWCPSSNSISYDFSSVEIVFVEEWWAGGTVALLHHHLC